MPHNSTFSSLANDASFIERYAQHLREEADAQHQFMVSDTFYQMCEALRSSPALRVADSEMLSFGGQDALQELGWGFATPDDVRRFFDGMGAVSAPTVEPGSYSEDSNGSFFCCSFRHFGLRVSMMFGQGTAITVSNE